MADPSTNYGWDLPDVAGDSGNWGTLLNDILANGTNDIDSTLKAVSDVADAALPKAGGTMTGELHLKTAVATRVDDATASGGTALDFDVANAWAMTATGSVTFSVSNVPSGTIIVGGILKLMNGGAHTITWPGAFKWPGGSAPSLTSSGVDLIVFVTLDGGTTWQANALLDIS